MANGSNLPNRADARSPGGHLAATGSPAQTGGGHSPPQRPAALPAPATDQSSDRHEIARGAVSTVPISAGRNRVPDAPPRGPAGRRDGARQNRTSNPRDSTSDS